ncbi:MAG: MATE family efflux transporter [Gammaproteobacteria bacterium]
MSTSSRSLTLREHARRTVALAVPVTIGRISIFGLVVEDTAMTGRSSAQELAYYSLANGPLSPLLLIGIGIMMGVVVFSAQSAGRGKLAECGQIWRLGLGLGLLVGAVMASLGHAGEWFLLLTGQASDLASGAGSAIILLAWGLPAVFVFAACTFFLEGLNRPLPGMVVMVGANGINIFLNWLLINGNLGLPALGADGAALATTLTRWAVAVAIVVYILTSLDHRTYGVSGPMPDARPLLTRLVRLGVPLAIALALESSSFATMTLLSGLLGPVQVSAFAIGFNLIAIVFMTAIGFATSASVRVANAIGRGDGPGVGTAGWTAVGIAAGLLGVSALVIAGFNEWFAGLYTTDAAVIAVAAPTIALAALALVPDGSQGAIGGALRGASDVWPATGLYLLSFWLVMVPLGYYIGIHLGRGAPGLMLAVFAGATVAVILLGARFHTVARRAASAA